jgi:hypothetical protein
MSGTLVNDKTNERIGAGRAAELLRNTEWLLCFSPAHVLGHGTAIRKLSGTYESCLVCCCAPSFRNLEEILALGQNTNHTRPQFGGSIQQKSLTWTESGPQFIRLGHSKPRGNVSVWCKTQIKLCPQFGGSIRKIHWFCLAGGLLATAQAMKHARAMFRGGAHTRNTE